MKEVPGMKEGIRIRNVGRCGEDVGTRVAQQFDEVLIAGKVDHDGGVRRSTSEDGLGLQKLCAGEVSAKTTWKYTGKLLVLRS